jgi:hypothetical protein
MKRYIPIAAVVACLSAAGTPALATDEPPPSTPPTAGTAPPATTPPAATTAPAATTPAACVDLTRPTSRVVSSSRSAVKRHVLRGSAGDQGCTGSSVALVTVSIFARHGTRCQYLTPSGRLSRKSNCSRPRWLAAKGTKHWSLRLPKRMPHGSYQVLTRAVDSAGNVERAHARRLAISRSRSTTKK